MLLSQDLSRAKIADVGLSRIMVGSHASSASDAVGTFSYAAPEQILGYKLTPKVRPPASSTERWAHDHSLECSSASCAAAPQHLPVTASPSVMISAYVLLCVQTLPSFTHSIAISDCLCETSPVWFWPLSSPWSGLQSKMLQP